MNDNKKPSEPLEPERWAQEIHLSQLDERILCQIDETFIQNVKAYSFAQYSNGKALLNLSIEIRFFHVAHLLADGSLPVLY